MNQRILKKLCKKAVPIIERLGINNGLEKVVVGRYGLESLDTHATVGKKYIDRWFGVPNTYGYFTMLNGTVGYGAMSGYYEPEWWDLDAWSMLRSYVIDSFSDGDNHEGGVHHNSRVPNKVYKLPSEVLKVAANLKGKSV